MTKKLELKNKSIQSLKEELHQLLAKYNKDKYGYEFKEIEQLYGLKKYQLTHKIKLLEEWVKRRKRNCRYMNHNYLHRC